jgi:hypothetical protein
MLLDGIDAGLGDIAHCSVGIAANKARTQKGLRMAIIHFRHCAV